MLSLVARGQYQFTDYVRLIGEVGGFYQKDSYNNGTSYKQAGEKYTIACWPGGRARTLCHVRNYAFLLHI